MIPNEAVYGAKNTWVDTYTADQTMLKNAKRPQWQTLYNGVENNKIVTKELIDKSIGYVGLGPESPYSKMITVNPDNSIVKLNLNVVDFFYGYNWGSYNYCFRVNKYNDNSWNVDTLDIYENTNCYKSVITQFDPKYLLWLIRVCVASNEHPTGSGDIANFYLYDYANDTTKQTQYPYLMTAYMCALYEQNTPENPNRYFDLTSSTSHPLTLCLNIEHEIQSHSKFITYNDCNPPTPWNDRGDFILLRGTSNNTGSSIYDGYNAVYVLGDEDYIKWQYGNFSYAEPYSEDVKDEIIKAAACFCNYFIADIRPTSPYNALNVPLTDNSVYLGYPDDKGISHGLWTRGTDNEDNPVWEWEDSTDSNYDYSKAVDPNTYEDSTYLPALINIPTQTRVYQDNTGTKLGNLTAFISGLDSTTVEYKFYNQEPMQCIVGARRIFLKPPEVSVQRETFISIGAFNTEIPIYSLGNQYDRFDLGSKLIYPIYDNCLDYEPYTTLSLYVPYCGVMKLPTAVFMNHYCKLTINANMRTGDIVALVFVDNIEYASLKGNASVELGLTGEEVSQYVRKEKEIQHNMNMIGLNMVSSSLGHIAGSSISKSFSNATGVTTQAAMGALDIVKGVVEFAHNSTILEHMKPEIVQIQQASTNVAIADALYPFIFIERPVFEDGYDEEKYAKTVGHSCYRIGKKSDFHGLTICADAKLDGLACTLKEQKMILAALQEGVILDEPE